jgi:hypothetical protein
MARCRQKYAGAYSVFRPTSTRPRVAMSICLSTRLTLDAYGGFWKHAGLCGCRCEARAYIPVSHLSPVYRLLDLARYHYRIILWPLRCFARAG